MINKSIDFCYNFKHTVLNLFKKLNVKDKNTKNLHCTFEHDLFRGQLSIVYSFKHLCFSSLTV